MRAILTRLHEVPLKGKYKIPYEVYNIAEDDEAVLVYWERLKDYRIFVLTTKSWVDNIGLGTLELIRLNGDIIYYNNIDGNCLWSAVITESDLDFMPDGKRMKVENAYDVYNALLDNMVSVEEFIELYEDAEGKIRWYRPEYINAGMMKEYDFNIHGLELVSVGVEDKYHFKAHYRTIDTSYDFLKMLLYKLRNYVVYIDYIRMHEKYADIVLDLSSMSPDIDYVDPIEKAKFIIK